MTGSSEKVMRSLLQKIFSASIGALICPDRIAQTAARTPN